MKHIIFVTAAAISLALSMPLHAQVSENSPASEEMDQNHTPGLQQTPDGQTMKMAVEDRPTKESHAVQTKDGASPTTSTGPTFPNDRQAK